MLEDDSENIEGTMKLNKKTYNKNLIIGKKNFRRFLL